MNKRGLVPLDKNAPLTGNYLAGLSLIEIIVATVILSLAAVSLTYVFISGRRHTIHTLSRVAAMELTRFYSAPLYMQVRQDQWASNCLGSSTGCPSIPADDIFITSKTYQANTTVYQNHSGTTLSKVKLTVRWNETTQ